MRARFALVASGLVGIVGLSGCGGDGGEELGATSAAASYSPPPPAQPKDPLPKAEPPVVVVPTPPDECSLALSWQSDLPSVLSACPALRDSLQWIDGAGRLVPYAAWSAEQQALLATYFGQYIKGATSVALDCPTPARNMQPSALAAGNVGALYFPAGQAFALYAAQVAHSLALEARGDVSWRLRFFPAGERAAILSADRRFAAIRPGTGDLPSGIVAGRDLQVAAGRSAVPSYVCQPAEGYAFVRGWTSTSGFDLVGANADQTVANLTLFTARNLAHGPTDPPDRAVATFGMDLDDRLRRRTDLSYAGFLAAPGGCHSAAALLQDLAALVNIPLENVALLAYSDISGWFTSRSHRGLAYRWTTTNARYLEHADDAYAVAAYGLKVKPAGQSAAAARTYFDATWVTSTALSGAGATIFTDLPTVIVGVGYGAQATLGSYFDYGRLLGFWPDAHPGVASARWNEYVARIEESMCGPRFVGEYCRNVGTGAGYRNLMMYSTSMWPHLSVASEAQRAWATTEACVLAAGSCPAAVNAARRTGPAETALAF